MVIGKKIPRRFLHQLESLHRNPALKYGLSPVLLRGAESEGRRSDLDAHGLSRQAKRAECTRAPDSARGRHLAANLDESDRCVERLNIGLSEYYP